MMKDSGKIVDLGPGSIIVVGPEGRFAVDPKSGVTVITGCLFLGSGLGGIMESDRKQFLDRVYSEYVDDNGKWS